ncbi:hypothetical protein SH580_20525 [Coraliomargarita algicola]|uniref:Alpha/beta hydrolase n=1 Tax=Coraliomargarita algicola TaxID=3092156 RepID=A0ABZ0RK19_9BACT|nr:hypothetical protein [Coraliomargarita sp. J2-16]WPJ95808.1 hypothetical protein SH580_20525 [Coraliomargarita sp. J2-16]
MLDTLCSRLCAKGATPIEWEGFNGYALNFKERVLRVVLPRMMASGSPWFWRPEFFGAFAQTDQMLLERGWVLVFLDLPDHYGCPHAVELFAAMHLFVTQSLGLSERMAVVALSRAGLSAYNFASRYPEKVCALYADNPVCDFRSWPGGIGVGPGSENDWRNLLKVYDLSHAEALAYADQPLSLEVLRPIVDAKIPILHVCGDRDEIVPYQENSLGLGQNVQQLGGDYQVIMIPGGKHHPHGLPDPTPIVAFLEASIPCH